MKQKSLLIITDGIGYDKNIEFNAFYQAKKPHYNKLFKEIPHSLIETYGLSVGLPNGQMGNSEVGHMTIGSGRVLYQDLVKISLSLQENSFIENQAFKKLLSQSDRLHLIGLLSDGGVHSHIEHLKGIASLAKKEGKMVLLHLITDGRDVSPTSAKNYLNSISSLIDDNCKIATIGGRFYTMDRDNRWDRVQKGYNAIVKAMPNTILTPNKYVDQSYSKDITDEFILPTAFEGYDGIKENDAILTFNFRSDRMREIVSAIGDKSFNGFKRDFIKTNIATITQYDQSFPYDVLFTKEAPKNTLAEVVANAGLTQLHTAETEKYAHVTFFLNGGVETPVKNETRVLIPSPDVKTYDLKPQMSAKEVADAVIDGIDSETDFIVVNFANGDMVGHTGNFEAAVRAVEVVDEQLERIWQKAKDKDYSIVLTSDHGNCEAMKDSDGNILTNHTVGDVWCFVDAKGVDKVQSGGLNNIAPTVLKLMGIDIPSQMDHPLI